MPGMMDYIAFAGPTVLSGASTVPTSAVLGSAKHLALYFSAHWCGPCRGFTPMLAKCHKSLRQAGVEILFISADHTEASFLEYYKEMPWKAMPFSSPRQGITEMCGVQGIPKLIVFNQMGAVVTADGVDLITDDPSGKTLLRLLQPASAPSLLALLSRSLAQADRKGALLAQLGAKLLAGQSIVPTAGVLSSSKLLGLYFSAHWCGPCRSFTPTLAQCSAILSDHGMQIAFVSFDHDEASFTEYYSQMPWKAVPFSKDRSSIGAHFGVQSIPAFVVVDTETGSIVTANGVDLLKNDPSCQSLLQLLPPSLKARPQPQAGVGAKPPVEKPTVNVALDSGAAGPTSVGPLLALLGPKLLHGRIEVRTATTLQRSRYVALFYGTQSCPECREFSRLLAQKSTYLNSLGLQVVYVSLDDTEDDFAAAFSRMPWKALPFGSKQRQAAQQHNSAGLPQLLILGLDGTIVSASGAQLLREDSTAQKLADVLQRQRSASL